MKEIKQQFTEHLAKVEFIRKADNWYFKNNELTIVVNIQKSNYDKLYFINVGIWFNIIEGENLYPKEHICHLRFRAEKLLTSIPQNLNPREIFDFNNTSYQSKLEDIKYFLLLYFCPLLNELKSINNLKILYNKKYFKNAYIEGDAREILSS